MVDPCCAASGVPHGDPQAAAAAAAEALTFRGVPAGALRIVSYDAQGVVDAPVTLRYARYVAQAPDCSGQWDNLLSTNSNTVSRHFGCATASNLAAMVANPRDLVAPQAMTPADGLRRTAVLEKYRRGEVTSSAKDTQASGAVSSVVQ